MNQQSDMLKRENIGATGYNYMTEQTEPEAKDLSQVVNHDQMMQRKTMPTGETTEKHLDFELPKQEEDIVEKSFDAPVQQPIVQKINDQQAAQEKMQMLKSKITKAQNNATQQTGKQAQPAQQQTQQPAQQQAQQQKQQTQQSKPQQAPAKQPEKMIDTIRLNTPLDDLAAEYIKLMETFFDIKLSHNICFDNMRKFCDMNVKNYDKTLYFVENTYRVSTLIYLTTNFPIIFICTVISEVNRKNVLKYISNEVEIAAKPFDEIRKIRFERYSNKFKSMDINDAATITPGITSLSHEVFQLMVSEFSMLCNKLKRFNKELTTIIANFNDEAKNDVIYIYSNWWYFLQLFENNVEARNYIMSITDDTRTNLKL